MRTDLLKYDAESIQDLLNQKLIESGLCGDAIYPGSDVRILMDLFSWTFGVLTYILNNTASNTVFDDTQVYQNLNKIVKLLSYNPQSYKTSHAQFLLQTNGKLFQGKSGTYVIPKFTTIDTGKSDQFGNQIYYSFVNDFQFQVQNGNIVSQNNPQLYNGKYYLYTFDEIVQGVNYETFTMRGASPQGELTQTIDRSGFSVIYQKINNKGNPQFTKIEIVQNIILDAEKDDLVCEVRLNQKKELTIKFGNGIHGKQLDPGGTLHAIYLVSNKDQGIIEANSTSVSQLKLDVNGIESTLNLINICYCGVQNFNLNYGKLFMSNNLPIKSINSLKLTNINKSSSVVDFESLDEIKQNAPSAFKSGNRLITSSDYNNYLLTNFNNVIDDVYVCNNNDYCTSFYAWLKKYDQLNIGIRQNNYVYANACDFNNIYLWLKPLKNNIITKEDKNNIIKACNKKKSLTTNIIPCVSLKYFITPYVKQQNGKTFQQYTNEEKQELKQKLLSSISSNECLAKIVIVKNKDFINVQHLKNSVSKIISTYFNQHSKLGTKLNISEILTQIYNLGCIQAVKTLSVVENDNSKTDIINYVNGLSFIGFTQDIVWFKDFEVFSQVKNLQNFQYPQLINNDAFVQYIEVVNDYSYITKNSKF